MPPAGNEILARWREAGEWWEGQPQREFCRYLDEKGIRREKSRELPCLADIRDEPPSRVPQPRDDKVAKAMGHLPSFNPSQLRGLVPQQPFAALHIVSGHALGRSTISSAEIVNLEAARRYQSVLLADPFSLAGAVEFHRNASEAGLHPLIGASFEMDEGGELVLVARNQVGYRNLSRLVTDCCLNEPRLFPLCTRERLMRRTEGLLCLTGGDLGPINRCLAKGNEQAARGWLDFLLHLYGRENTFIQIERSYLPWEISVNRKLLELGEKFGVVAVAGGPITHRTLGDFPAQDAIACVETLCLIEELEGRKPRRDPSQPQILLPPRRALNAERYLRTPDQMLRLFADRPDLVQNTLRVAERCEENVFPGRTDLPPFCENETEMLRIKTYEGAARLFGSVNRKQIARLEMELRRLQKNRFEGHFLIAWDMCQWAREQGIVLSGRGSVVDSFVAYCLGLSRIDALKHNLHFDRFLPEEAKKRPDIDIDFEAKRRDDVRNYLVGKYGKAHVATVAAIGTYRTRGIVREVGKVMGIPSEDLSYLVKRLHGSVSPDRLEQEIERKPELRNSNIPRERFHWVFRLANLMMDLPRSLRSHSSGVVISREPVCDVVPVTHSAVDGVDIIQWDKRSAKGFFDKFDVLCLRGNDVLSDIQQRIRVRSSEFNVETLDVEDEEAFRAMRAGQLIGIPQSASPAMRQAHIRLKTKNFRDAGIVQAAIRPGVGGAVKLTELIHRRNGKDFSFNHPELQRILQPTYGVIVFQEQVDMLLQTFGGYSSDQAEEIREAIYQKRQESYVQGIREAVLEKIVSRGHPPEIAEEVYGLVAQFQGYGFAEGHALAFADISIRSIHCQQNYPAPFFAALLDAQPAGYYGPCTLANEARNRGVKVNSVCVNRSQAKFTVEDVMSTEDPKLVLPQGAIRVSLSQIKGLSKQTAEKIVVRKPYESFFDFVAKVRPPKDELECLILCGALDSLHPNRRSLLWSIPRAIRYGDLRQGDGDPSRLELSIPEPDLPEDIEDFTSMEKAMFERQVLEMDTERHLMAFERERVRSKGGVTAMEAGSLPDRSKYFVVGNPIRLRFPPTSSGNRVMFFDLEDETGLLNVTCFNETYLKYGHAVICNPYVTLFGEAQNRDGHTAFLASRILPYRPSLKTSEESQKKMFAIADFLVS